MKFPKLLLDQLLRPVHLTLTPNDVEMAQPQTVMQLLELFQFLSDPQAPVRRIALANLL